MATGSNQPTDILALGAINHQASVIFNYKTYS